MRNVHACADCGFHALLGRQDLDDRLTGYREATMLICLMCGTGHRTLHGEAAELRGEYERYEVRILSAGGDRIALIKAVRHARDCGLHEAQKLLDVPPFVLITVEGLEHAEEWVRTIRGMGALAELRGLGQVRKQRAEYPERLQGQAGPCVSRFGAFQGYAGAWRELPAVRSEGTGELSVEAQSCGCCGSRGQLIDFVPAGAMPCPTCDSGRLQRLDEDQWLTAALG